MAEILRKDEYQKNRLKTLQRSHGQSYNLKGGIHFINDDSQHSGQPGRSGPVISRVLNYVPGISFIESMLSTYQKQRLH